MKLHYLKYFCILAEELHFHRAADRLAISQPPLSAGIKALELELGVQLLRRNSKVVELTPAGAAFLVEAKAILDRVSRIGGLVRAFDAGLQGRLDIGISGSLLYREAPKIISSFQSQHPFIDVVLHELSTAEQIEKLCRREMHAGFLHGSNVPAQLVSLPLKSDQFVLCLSDRHTLAGRMKIDLRELSEDRFVMFSREAAPSNHDNVIAIFNAAGIHPRTIHSARTWSTIMAMVDQVSGVAVVPKSMSRACINGLRFIPFEGIPAAAPAMLVWHANSVPAELGKFLACASQILDAPLSPEGPGAIRPFS